MTNTSFDPPTPAPTNGNDKQLSIGKNQLIVTMIVIAIIALLIGFAAGPSDKSSSSNTTSAPATTAYVPPVTQAPVRGNDYNAYVNYVYDNSSLASQLTTAKIREYGDTICTTLDNGNSISWVVTYLSDSGNTTQDNELYASIIFGAITYICPQYEADLNAYLSTTN